MIKVILQKIILILVGVILAFIFLNIFGKLHEEPRVGAYIITESSLEEITKNLCLKSIPFSISITVPEKYRKEYEEIILPYGVPPEKSDWKCESK